jgi:hypothetical protein
MSTWLRWLGTLVLALGLGMAGYAGTRAAGEAAQFAEVADLYARHQDHPLFQAQYYAAAFRHYGLVAGAIGAALGGIVFGSLLLGVGALVARATPRDR